jgi:deoxyribodipyrimidine photo-lyase
MKVNIFWFRRDLRLEDNTALYQALDSGLSVLPLFIFDTNITAELVRDDPRVSFINDSLKKINATLNESGSSVYVLKGDPVSVWKKLVNEFEIDSVFINKDYEPYSIHRDSAVELLLRERNIRLRRFKDQIIFEEGEILKTDKTPYTIFTPYKNKWVAEYKSGTYGQSADPELKSDAFLKKIYPFPELKEHGFRESSIRVRPYDLSDIADYHKHRDIPSLDKTSYLSPHLRFGTVSIRQVVKAAFSENLVFLNELIWREFFMQILFNFPHVVTGNFKPAYDDIAWRNDEMEFEKWCRGETGYPIVDAGMRQLNSTGYMHNRVRMIVAGFLCKHLLIDWRWGEAYFAQKLLDYELSSNNGNWQWAAGTGCDAAPYFRVFNPETQRQKFDPQNEYIKKWVEDFGSQDYPQKMVDHDFARQRAISSYKNGIKLKLTN